MDLSHTEVRIILRIYDICFLSLNDEIAIPLLYDITSKQYLWNNIKRLQDIGIITCSKHGRKKYARLTDHGKKVSKILNSLRNEMKK